MVTSPSISYKKATQALNYFARKKDGKINKMKAIKLIYFADRYHLRKYGRPVVGDMYWAMKFGPVGSHALDVADLDKGVDQVCLKYASGFIDHPKGDDKARTVASKKEVDLDVFSQTDIEALESVYKEFGGYDGFELADIAHKYPEWSKFRKEIIDEGKKRVQMDYKDFFANPKGTASDFFELPQEHLDITKAVFEENQEAALFLR